MRRRLRAKLPELTPPEICESFMRPGARVDSPLILPAAARQVSLMHSGTKFPGDVREPGDADAVMRAGLRSRHHRQNESPPIGNLADLMPVSESPRPSTPGRRRTFVTLAPSMFERRWTRFGPSASLWKLRHRQATPSLYYSLCCRWASGLRRSFPAQEKLPEGAR
jgi:hypothetical protein